MKGIVKQTLLFRSIYKVDVPFVLTGNIQIVHIHTSNDPLRVHDLLVSASERESLQRTWPTLSSRVC